MSHNLYLNSDGYSTSMFSSSGNSSCGSISCDTSTSTKPKRKLISSLLNVNENGSVTTKKQANSVNREDLLRSKKKQRDPLAHRRVEKTRRDRMNLSLIKLGSLIPNNFLRKGYSRVDKIRTVDLAIEYIRYLQENERKRKARKRERNGLSSKNSSSPQSSTSPQNYSSDSSPRSKEETTSKSSTEATVASATLMKETCAVKDCKASENNNNLLVSNHNSNLLYMKGIFDGSIEFVGFVVSYLRRQLSDPDTLKSNTIFYYDMLSKFNAMCFSQQNIEQRDYDYISKTFFNNFDISDRELIQDIVNSVNTSHELDARVNKKDSQHQNNSSKSQQILKSLNPSQGICTRPVNKTDSSTSLVTLFNSSCNYMNTIGSLSSDTNYESYGTNNTPTPKTPEQTDSLNQFSYIKLKRELAKSCVENNLKEKRTSLDLNNNNKNTSNYNNNNSHNNNNNNNTVSSINNINSNNSNNGNSSRNYNQNNMNMNSNNYLQQTNYRVPQLVYSVEDNQNNLLGLPSEYILQPALSSSLKLQQQNQQNLQLPSWYINPVKENSYFNKAKLAEMSSTENKNENIYHRSSTLQDSMDLEKLHRYNKTIASDYDTLPYEKLDDENEQTNKKMLSVFVLHASNDYYIGGCLDESLIDKTTLNSIIRNDSFKPKNLHKIKLDVVFSSDIVITMPSNKHHKSIKYHNKLSMPQTFVQPKQPNMRFS